MTFEQSSLFRRFGRSVGAQIYGYGILFRAGMTQQEFIEENYEEENYEDDD